MISEKSGRTSRQQPKPDLADKVMDGPPLSGTKPEDLRGWLKRVGLPYWSPHKFRHGHIQWGLMHSKDRAQFKSISENVMHSNTRITDEIYSNLKEAEIKSRILSLGDRNSNGSSNLEIIEGLESLLENLKSY